MQVNAGPVAVVLATSSPARFVFHTAALYALALAAIVK